jgi:hypothetical protein
VAWIFSISGISPFFFGGPRILNFQGNHFFKDIAFFFLVHAVMFVIFASVPQLLAIFL